MSTSLKQAQHSIGPLLLAAFFALLPAIASAQLQKGPEYDKRMAVEGADFIQYCEAKEHPPAEQETLDSLMGESCLSLYEAIVKGDTVVLNNKGIKDISFLRHMPPTITVVQLSNNKIVDVSPLASLPNLKEIILEWNQVSDISPLVGMTNLNRLSMGHNKIASLEQPLKFNPRTAMNLEGNPIPLDTCMLDAPSTSISFFCFKPLFDAAFKQVPEDAELAQDDLDAIVNVVLANRNISGEFKQEGWLAGSPRLILLQRWAGREAHAQALGKPVEMAASGDDLKTVWQVSLERRGDFCKVVLKHAKKRLIGTFLLHKGEKGWSVGWLAVYNV